MDLSKIPELELRQKLKPINDRLAAIDAEIERIEDDEEAKMAAVLKPIRDRLDAVRNELASARDAECEKMRAICKPLRDERDGLDAQLGQLLGDDRIIAGTCELTGLPIFDDDESMMCTVLACVADSAKAAA